MKKFLAYLRLSWQTILVYRGDVFVYTLSGIFTPIVGLLIWSTLVSSGGNFVYNNTEIINYFLLVIIVNNVTFAWKGYFIGEDINKGDISKVLLKPTNLISAYISGSLAEKAFQLFFVILFIAFTWIFLLKGAISFDFNFFSICLFLISLTMAYFISFLLELAAGLAAFWVHEVDFLIALYILLVSVLSGRLIPLAFFPTWLSEINNILPFRYIVSFPVEILTGKLTAEQLVFGISMQIGWFIGCVLLYKVLVHFGLKLYSAYGQ